MIRASEARSLVKACKEEKYRKECEAAYEFMNKEVSPKVKYAAECGQTRITVSFSGEIFTPEMLAEALRKLGYSVVTDETTATIMWEE